MIQAASPKCSGTSGLTEITFVGWISWWCNMGIGTKHKSVSSRTKTFLDLHFTMASSKVALTDIYHLYCIIDCSDLFRPSPFRSRCYEGRSSFFVIGKLRGDLTNIIVICAGIFDLLLLHARISPIHLPKKIDLLSPP